MPTDLTNLQGQIDALSPPDRLRLAASLMEAGKGTMAHTIAERVVLELGATILLARPQAPGRGGMG